MTQLPEDQKVGDGPVTLIGLRNQPAVKQKSIKEK
jgi:hypothetical protein